MSRPGIITLGNMNATLIRALFIAVPVTTALLASVISVRRARTFPAALMVGGTVCLEVVVLAHVAEAMRWLPRTRWGEPNSAGHYVDLVSAVTAVLLLTVGGMMWAIRHGRRLE